MMDLCFKTSLLMLLSQVGTCKQRTLKILFFFLKKIVKYLVCPHNYRQLKRIPIINEVTNVILNNIHIVKYYLFKELRKLQDDALRNTSFYDVFVLW